MGRDLYNKGRQLANKLEAIKKSKEISAKNKEILLSYLEWGKIHGKKGEGWSESRCVKNVCEVYSLAVWLGKDFPEATLKDIERVVVKIRDSGYEESTKTSYNVALRSFFRWLYSTPFVTKEVRMDGDTYPPIVKWVSVSEKKHKKKTSDMIFSEDEIRAMLPFAYTPRDKGFLYCLFQSGARDGEFLNMKVDDVKFDKYGALLTLRVSKTIPRTVRIVESAKELGAWLNVHPQKNNGDAWLWINVKGEPMTPFNARKVLNDIAERAQITKKIYPHILRHSCATIKGKWMNVLQLQKFFGWSEGSKEAGTYCHLTDLDVGNIELEHRGIKEKQDSKLREVIVNCPNCGKICGAQDTHCLTCGLPLNTHASDTIAELTKQVKYLTSWVSDMKLKQIVKEEGGLH